MDNTWNAETFHQQMQYQKDDTARLEAHIAQMKLDATKTARLEAHITVKQRAEPKQKRAVSAAVKRRGMKRVAYNAQQHATKAVAVPAAEQNKRDEDEAVEDEVEEVSRV